MYKFHLFEAGCDCVTRHFLIQCDLNMFWFSLVDWSRHLKTLAFTVWINENSLLTLYVVLASIFPILLFGFFITQVCPCSSRLNTEKTSESLTAMELCCFPCSLAQITSAQNVSSKKKYFSTFVNSLYKFILSVTFSRSGPDLTDTFSSKRPLKAKW